MSMAIAIHGFCEDECMGRKDEEDMVRDEGLLP